MRVLLALRWVGYLLLAVVLVATMLIVEPPLARRAVWLVCFAGFAIAFHVGATAAGRAVRIVALAVQVVAMLAMAALLPCYFGALSLVLVASQATLQLSARHAAAWIVGQTALLGGLMMQALPVDDCIASLIALLGFQSFAAVAVYAARGESEARQALARANAELRATRALLAEASRASERTRIARELHDVVGHDLTALGLQLEIATHVATDRVPEHVAKARHVNARLLRNVRDVVSELRASESTDLREALHTLVEDLPGIAVHLRMPDALPIDDARRAHCVLRCVQEIVTNTLRHAGAANLWISIAQTEDGLVVDARDDGHGATALTAGHGLSGMRARLEELGGFLQIAAAPSFAVTAQLPRGGRA